MVAKPGDMGVLSVSVQYYCAVGLGPVVPAALFFPPPKVDSQILMLEYKGPHYKNVDTKKYFQIVRAGFSERRKKLRSSLAGGLRINKLESSRLLEEAGIDPRRRAQELTLAEWHNLYLELMKPVKL